LISDGASPPVYTAVGQVQEIGDISVTAEEVDVTTLDSGDYHDYIQGFKDPGECQITVLFDPAMADQDDSPDGLIGLFISGETRNCAIRWNASNTGGQEYGLFQAFLRDMDYAALNASDPQTIQPTFRLRSPITLADTLPITLVGGATTVLTAAAADRAAKKAAADAAAAKTAADTAAKTAADRAAAAQAAAQAAQEATAKAAQLAADECTQKAQLAAQLSGQQTSPVAPTGGTL